MKRALGFAFVMLFAFNAMAFELTSADVKNGRPMTKVQEYKGIGLCRRQSFTRAGLEGCA